MLILLITQWLGVVLCRTVALVGNRKTQLITYSLYGSIYVLICVRPAFFRFIKTNYTSPLMCQEALDFPLHCYSRWPSISSVLYCTLRICTLHYKMDYADYQQCVCTTIALYFLRALNIITKASYNSKIIETSLLYLGFRLPFIYVITAYLKIQ